MNERPELMKEVARWAEKAEHDFLAAEHALEMAQAVRQAVLKQLP